MSYLMHKKINDLNKELNLLFPDKKVFRLQDYFKKLSNAIYNFMVSFPEYKDLFKSEDINVKNKISYYLSTQGFKYFETLDLVPKEDLFLVENKMFRHNKALFRELIRETDFNIIFVLEMLKCNGYYLAIWLSTSLDSKSLPEPIEKLTEHDLITFDDMIETRRVKYSNGTLHYQILKQKVGEYFYLLVRDTSTYRTLKLSSKQPSSLFENLIKKGFDVFKEKELNFLHKLAMYDTKNPQGYTLTISETGTLKRMVKKSNKFKDVQDFYKYFGFNNLSVIKGVPRNKKIFEIIEANMDDTGHVFFEDKQSKDYKKIYHFAYNNCGITIEKLMEEYGFKYIGNQDGQRYERLLERILKFRVDEELSTANKKTKVYIPSGTKLYNLLRVDSSIQKMSFKDYLENYYNVELVGKPKNYTPVLEEIDGRDDFKELELIRMVEENCKLVSNDNKIYLESKTLPHKKIWSYATQINYDEDELLKEWGFERLSKREAEDYLKNIQSPINTNRAFLQLQDDDVEIDKVEDFLLGNIRKLQSNLNTTKQPVEQIARSRQLVVLLKELYDYTCQICGNENSDQIPQIITKEGKKYVEVHHIVPLHEGIGANDESEEFLDSYKNVIVLCPHHHKVMHYEYGGYKKLLEKEGELFFLNNTDSNRLIHIRLNKHLEPSFERTLQKI
ncbi:HNH endonuclease [Ureibacillus acetophenoni]|uniref:HNH endonuclease n=1 Tax=Ureibacillus acetophenoni TaxID=614649 RepID=A0A285UCC5_9BACL|nr:HNH endonuclease [Ureibacillus acetophenoni]SOC39058.1 HNH endonuclease [Ureibacillus acetophenoni]